MRLFSLALLLGVVAAALDGAAALNTEYDDIMGPLLHMERRPQDPAQFRFDLAPWTAIIDDADTQPHLAPANPKLLSFLKKMHALRHLEARDAAEGKKKKKKKAKKKAKKGAAALQPDEAPLPKMVVVGAGPNGLVAALLGRYYGYDVEVIEMSDGRDARWNMVMVQGTELKAFLANVVGISSVAYYSVAEMQYVLGAAAQLAGARIRFGHQYVRHCPGDKAVLFRPTPQDAHARRNQPDKSVCQTPGQLQRIAPVKLVVGADGIRSFVREAMVGTVLKMAKLGNNALETVRQLRLSNTLKPVSVFRSHFRLRASIDGPPTVSHSPEYTLLPAGADPVADPLMAMLIFQFRAPPAGVTAVTAPPVLFESRSASQAGVQQRRFTGMFATPGHLDRERAMAKLIWKESKRVVIRTPTAADPATHEFQDYKYVDVVFRHRAGKALWAAFQGLTVDGKLAEVAKYARGEANTLSELERRGVADRLLRVMHETGAAAAGANGYGVTLAEFKQQIDSIKLFGQQLRYAEQVHTHHDGMEVVLVGDSSRDSYFPHGESFSTAANAFVRFMAAKAAQRQGSKSLLPAAQFYKEEVDDFLNVTASSIYFEGFCGIAQLETDGFDALSWRTTRALAPANDPFILHLNQHPENVAATPNGHYPATQAVFTIDSGRSSRDSMKWNTDTRYRSYETGWDDFVQNVLHPRCETW